MSMLKNASTWLAAQREKFLALDCLYINKKGEEFAIKATIGKTEFYAPDAYGIVVKMEYRDFIFRPPETEDTFTPQSGDIILWDQQEYEVLAPESRTVWKWSDPFKTSIRVHTKHLKPHTP